MSRYLQGEIANAFAELMAKLWSDEYQSIAPTSFKRTLDKHAPQFKGHDQHDSQVIYQWFLLGCLVFTLCFAWWSH